MNRHEFAQQIAIVGFLLIIIVGCASSPTPIPPATLLLPTLTTARTSTTVPPIPTMTRTLTPVPATLVLPTETPPAVIHSTGRLAIPQTFLVDLDEGVITLSGADIWYEAVTKDERYLSPQNGATFIQVGSRALGLSGCQAAPFSGNRISFNNLPIGTFVCVRTNLGRISQIRILSLVNPGNGTLTLEIEYTTW